MKIIIRYMAILSAMALLVFLIAPAFKKNDDRAPTGKVFLLSPRQMETLEREGLTNAKAASQLYDYYSFGCYDEKKSMIWGRRAAELGNPAAQYSWAILIKTQGGSMEEYRKWLSLAAAQGEPGAIKALKEFEKEK